MKKKKPHQSKRGWHKNKHHSPKFIMNRKIQLQKQEQVQQKSQCDKESVHDLFKQG